MVGLGAQLLLSGCAFQPLDGAQGGQVDPATGEPLDGARGGPTAMGRGRIPAAKAVALVTRPVARELTATLLSKNPEYESALLALRAGIDSLFLGRREITPESIADWTDALAASHSLDSEDAQTIAFYIMDAYELYRSYVPAGTILSTDPDVQLVLRAFRDGIDQGLQFHNAFKR